MEFMKVLLDKFYKKVYVIFGRRVFEEVLREIVIVVSLDRFIFF